MLPAIQITDTTVSVSITVTNTSSPSRSVESIELLHAFHRDARRQQPLR